MPFIFTYRQKKGQNFHDFVTELKKLNSQTEFDNLHDYLIKDMIACATRDKFLHKRFFWECNLTVPNAISAGHAAEETRKHARKILRTETTANIIDFWKETQ